METFPGMRLKGLQTDYNIMPQEIQFYSEFDFDQSPRFWEEPSKSWFKDGYIFV